MDYVYYITKCKNFKAHSVVLMKYKTGVSLRPEVTTASCPIGIPPSVVPLFLTCIVSLRICRALFSGRFDIPASSINFFCKFFYFCIALHFFDYYYNNIAFAKRLRPVYTQAKTGLETRPVFDYCLQVHYLPANSFFSIFSNSCVISIKARTLWNGPFQSLPLIWLIGVPSQCR